jgi:hypothetical protein
MARLKARAKAEAEAATKAEAEAKAKPPEPKAATNDQARALDDALAKLEAELASERSGTKGPEPKPPQPGEWCMAFSAVGLEAIAAHLDALKTRISELEAELARERGQKGYRQRQARSA